MSASHFSLIDALLLLVALAAIVGVAWRVRRTVRNAEQFFFGTRALPGWVAGIGLLVANIGLPEVIGMAAAGAMYGFSAAHFFWLGAVPAMVFLGLVMVPVYRSAGARTIPEYLALRFDERSRTLTAAAFAVTSLVIGGIALHVAGTVLHLLLDWPFWGGVALAASVATVCVLAGGLAASIYAGVLQFALVAFGLAPLLLVGFAATDGWKLLLHRLSQAAINSQIPPAIYTSLWKGMGHPLTNAFGVTHLALIAGVGGAFAFGTWCGDMRVMQRAVAANSSASARRAPLIAAIPMLLLPAILVVPGALARMLGGGEAGTPFGGMAQGLIPARRAADGTALLDGAGHSLLDFGIALPKLIATLYPAGVLGLAVAALLAACTAGLAANLTTFSTVVRADLSATRSGGAMSDGVAGLRGARAATLAGIALAIAFAYAVRGYGASAHGMRAAGAGGAYAIGGVGAVLDVLTLLVAAVNVPIFVVLVLGMTWRRITSQGALAGLVAGFVVAIGHHALSLSRGAVPGLAGGFAGILFPYYTPLAQRLWTTIVALVAAGVATVAVSLITPPSSDAELAGRVFSRELLRGEAHAPWWDRPGPFAALLLVAAFLLTRQFR